ncbi:hypothetical protein EBZ80_13645 [bacterium]|nr:hypothetical protein [bacterium]
MVEVNQSIGNYLSHYFWAYVLAVLRQQPFSKPSTDRPILRDLPETVPFSPRLAEVLRRAGFTVERLEKMNPNSFWVIRDDGTAAVMEALRPWGKHLLRKALEKNGLLVRSPYPVIHFRCSDVPFARNPNYHLVRAEFYRDCLEEIRQKIGFSPCVVLLSCHAHNTDRRRETQCSAYAEGIRRYVTGLGYRVLVRCETPEQDFATMLNAPAVITPGSSFSFFAGFMGSGVFLSEGHFFEPSPNRCGTACAGWLRKGYTLLHRDVPSYEGDPEILLKRLGYVSK